MPRTPRLLLLITALGAIGAGTALAATDQEQSSISAMSPMEAAERATVAVADVQPAIRDAFALFRDRPASRMPDGVAEQVGSSRRFGRNAALARAIQTVTGTGWVIPGDGFLCLAVPDPIDGYGTSCVPTDVAIRQGLIVTLRGDADQQSADTILVPDGARAMVSQPDGSEEALPTDAGIVSVWTDRPGALHIG